MRIRERDGGGGGVLTRQRDSGEQRERGENELGETSKGFFGRVTGTTDICMRLAFYIILRRDGASEGKRTS